ncbi:MAG: sigma-70 family RNA polymerase sigma factor [Planctomycetaceae bacterium]|nr:sigma-70 family RNA polymerase sigma factor [Planctomycetaceae bacterium]
MPLSDEELIEQLKTGDQAALAEFIDRRRPQLTAFIEKRMSDKLRTKVEASDIFQEVTVASLNALDDVELGDRDPFSWLCQQAERRIIDTHRHHFGAQKRAAHGEVGLHAPAAGREEGQIADLVAATMTSASSAFSRQQKEYHMLEALNGLTDDAREALRLRYMEGLPSKEIAERLGKSDGATRVLLSRSLTKLQEILSGNSEFQSLIIQRPNSE